MNDIKEDLVFLLKEVTPKITQRDTFQIVEVLGDDWKIYTENGEALAAVNVKNPDKFHYNIYGGSFYINELFKSLGIDKSVKITGK